MGTSSGCLCFKDKVGDLCLERFLTCKGGNQEAFLERLHLSSLNAACTCPHHADPSTVKVLLGLSSTGADRRRGLLKLGNRCNDLTIRIHLNQNQQGLEASYTCFSNLQVCQNARAALIDLFRCCARQWPNLFFLGVSAALVLLSVAFNL